MVQNQQNQVHWFFLATEIPWESLTADVQNRITAYLKSARPGYRVWIHESVTREIYMDISRLYATTTRLDSQDTSLRSRGMAVADNVGIDSTRLSVCQKQVASTLQPPCHIVDLYSDKTTI